VRLNFRRFDLKLAHSWRISSGGNMGGVTTFPVALLELSAGEITGLGEAAPSSRYGENVDGCLDFFKSIDPSRISFSNIPGSMEYLYSIAPGHFAAKAALNVALLDGASRFVRQPLHEFLGLPFREQHHVTSFSIGIDRPEIIREKTLQAAVFPILKLKVGVPDDQANFTALREAAPDKWVRLDANEGWKTREQALKMLEWFARDAKIQFVEQPMPANSNPADLAWLKQRSPLPLFADESCLSSADIPFCAGHFHGVCVKLVKTGGITEAMAALRAARQAGLKTMLGCMIESSILISAGAHLAELADYLDLDGNLLITNDPFSGVTASDGLLSFVNSPEPFGLRVRPKS